LIGQNIRVSRREEACVNLISGWWVRRGKGEFLCYEVAAFVDVGQIWACLESDENWACLRGL
jgi:hypothetical protein